jgi:hypothetical protein
VTNLLDKIGGVFDYVSGDVDGGGKTLSTQKDEDDDSSSTSNASTLTCGQSDNNDND